MSRFSRLMAMFLDHATMCLILVPILIINEEYLHITPLSYLGIALYLNKDFFHGKSIAKRWLGFQLVDHRQHTKANELQCFIRNTLPFLWMLEVIWLLVYPKRRLGDWLAHTRVIEAERQSFHSLLADIRHYKLSNYGIYALVATLLYFLLVHFVVIPYFSYPLPT